MRKLIVSATAVVALVGVSYFIGSAWGQNAGAGAAPAKDGPHKVGLIDLAFIFKDYKKFETLREDLKGEIQESEGQAKLLADKIQKLTGELKSGTIKEGSSDFIEREKQITQLTAEFESFRKNAQREFLRKESKIYHTIYLEVSDAVDRFCKFYNYTVVLRFSRDDLNSTDPQKLIQGLNRQVVYFRPEDDMTDSVLDFLNKNYAKSAGVKGAPKVAPKAKKDNNVKPASGVRPSN